MNTNNNNNTRIKTIREHIRSFPAMIAISYDQFLFAKDDNLYDIKGKLVIEDYPHNLLALEDNKYKNLLCCSCLSMDHALESYKDWKQAPIEFTEAVRAEMELRRFNMMIEQSIKRMSNMFGLFDELDKYPDDDLDDDLDGDLDFDFPDYDPEDPD